MKKPAPYRSPDTQPVRPGANDALKIPSLHNGERIERKLPVAMCVGHSKVFTGSAK